MSSKPGFRRLNGRNGNGGGGNGHVGLGVAAGIGIVLGILAVVFSGIAAFRDTTQPPAEKVYQRVEFELENSHISTCDGSFHGMLLSQLSPMEVSIAAVFPPDPYQCDATTHVDGLFQLRSEQLNDTIFGNNGWSVDAGLGVRPEETIRYEVRASFNHTMNFTAASAIYGSNLFESNPRLDERLGNPGIIMLLFDTHSPSCTGTGLCLTTVCFFAARDGIWAYNDFGFSPDATMVIPKNINHGRLVKRFDTSLPHNYRGEYDRQNRKLRWFIDDDLVLERSIVVGAEPRIAGEFYGEKNSAPPVAIDPNFASLVVISGNTGHGYLVEHPSTTGLERVPIPAGHTFDVPTTFHVDPADTTWERLTGIDVANAVVSKFVSP